MFPAFLNWLKDYQGFLGGLALLIVIDVFAAPLVRNLARGQLRRSRVDPQFALLAVRLIYLAVLLVGLVVFFSFWVGNLTLVFGGFGVFALAFSLAFQDILKNFIAGVFLLLERPFRLGDEITVDGRTGVVENVQMRTTTLRSPEGEEILIPNSVVYTTTLVNRTRFPSRMFTVTAKIPTGVELDGLREKVRESLQRNEAILKDPAPQVGVQSNIDAGLTLEVRYWLDYRKNDPLAVQAIIGQQIYQAIGGLSKPA
jgi:small-conductance mechanosensitive channel